jgi:hypothetical protein
LDGFSRHQTHPGHEARTGAWEGLPERFVLAKENTSGQKPKVQHLLQRAGTGPSASASTFISGIASARARTSLGLAQLLRHQTGDNVAQPVRVEKGTSETWLATSSLAVNPFLEQNIKETFKRLLHAWNTM